MPNNPACKILIQQQLYLIAQDDQRDGHCSCSKDRSILRSSLAGSLSGLFPSSLLFLRTFAFHFSFSSLSISLYLSIYTTHNLAPPTHISLEVGTPIVVTERSKLFKQKEGNQEEELHSAPTSSL